MLHGNYNLTSRKILIITLYDGKNLRKMVYTAPLRVDSAYLLILLLREQRRDASMEEIENCYPPWLEKLLKVEFYVDCQVHKQYRCNQCNRYCIECTGNPFCAHCLDDHKNHKVIQIRRSSLSNAVGVDDIKEHMNVCGVQTYSINKRLIVFLNSRPYTGFPYGVTNVCKICHRSLPAGNFKFCCLSCKRKAIYHRFAKQTVAAETKLGTCELDDSFENEQSLTPEKKMKVRRLDKLVAKSPVASTSVPEQVAGIIYPPAATMFNHVNSRKRKGIPRRAPLT